MTRHGTVNQSLYAWERTLNARNGARERGRENIPCGWFSVTQVSFKKCLSLFVSLLSPISSDYHWSKGGKTHGSRSRSPARISQQPQLQGPPQHTPLQGHNQQRQPKRKGAYRVMYKCTKPHLSFF